MNLVKNLVRDLVDKKLWPVAAALVAALVAVPVVLGSGAEPASTESEQVIAQRTGGVAVEPPVTARVSVNTESSDVKVRRPGAVRNPFEQKHQPKPAAEAATAGATETKTDAGNTGSGGKTVEPDKGAIVPLPDVKVPVAGDSGKATAAQRRVYRVAIRFGEAGAVTTRRDLARLKALPSFSKPLVMFMGVLSDGKTAAFLLAPGVQATGQGWCRPSRANCQTLEMRAGDDEALEARSGTGGVVQYNLKVLRVERKVFKSAAKAEAKHARYSKAGRELLRAAIAKDVPGAGAYKFDSDYGILRLR